MPLALPHMHHEPGGTPPAQVPVEDSPSSGGIVTETMATAASPSTSHFSTDTFEYPRAEAAAAPVTQIHVSTTVEEPAVPLATRLKTPNAGHHHPAHKNIVNQSKSSSGKNEK